MVALVTPKTLRLLVPSSGRYVVDVTPQGICYGTREQALQLSESLALHVREFLPDGPHLVEDREE